MTGQQSPPELGRGLAAPGTVLDLPVGALVVSLGNELLVGLVVVVVFLIVRTSVSVSALACSTRSVDVAMLQVSTGGAFERDRRRRSIGLCPTFSNSSVSVSDSQPLGIEKSRASTILKRHFQGYTYSFVGCCAVVAESASPFPSMAVASIAPMSGGYSCRPLLLLWFVPSTDLDEKKSITESMFGSWIFSVSSGRKVDSSWRSAKKPRKHC